MKGGAEPISVAVFPGFDIEDPGNPYFPLLYENLQNFGIEHSRGKIPSINPLWLFKNRKKFSVLHFHWMSHYYDSRWSAYLLVKVSLFVFSLLVARLLGYRIVWTVHEPWPLDAAGTRKLLYKILARVTARCASALIVHTEWAKTEIDRWAGNSSIYVIQHGHYGDFYPHVPTTEEAKRKLGVPNNSFLYLFFGTLLPYKGIEEALRAFARIRQEEDLFWIVGEVRDYAYGRRLRELERANPAVHLEEHFIPHSELPLYLSACDCIVAPYISIFTSGVLPLALSFKKPFIAPQHPALVEQIPEESGVFYDPGKVKELEEAFRKVKLLDAEVIFKSAENWMSSHSWISIAEDSASIIQRVATADLDER